MPQEGIDSRDDSDPDEFDPIRFSGPTERPIRTSGNRSTMSVDLAFEDNELLPAIAQDADSGEVLMLAYVSEEALDRSRKTGEAHYYSRSREELWHKGGSSGHVQRIEEIRVDCDGDAILYLVEQEGGACHTGYASCFHRRIDGEIVGEKVFDPESVYE
jgi:phosphoribosyl-AMP cyclohydrolase